MKQIIYSYYKGADKKEKRGTLQDGVFYRDRVPLVWGRFIGLEVDVIEQLEKLGCIRMDFDLRSGKKVLTTLERFKGSMTKNTGVPDKRLQYFFDTEQEKVKPKADPKQGDLFEATRR